MAKLANEAYDAAQAHSAEARSFADAEAVITAFTSRFNTLKGIETAEREGRSRQRLFFGENNSQLHFYL
ncbi:hypothetical protein GCM10010917_19460 [Paenibacillus physcomitrellae]|uniref:Uncharacterized protein n=1 Tax=Paenibacillus physcomitrellae TaxID=1619311 RepID=A0ABQ1FZ35_9BACL|nr:hypothetical protein GCM10010917_19460 [Paenibacillus physcomitrellae]